MSPVGKRLIYAVVAALVLMVSAWTALRMVLASASVRAAVEQAADHAVKALLPGAKLTVGATAGHGLAGLRVMDIKLGLGGGAPVAIPVEARVSTAVTSIFRATLPVKFSILVEGVEAVAGSAAFDRGKLAVSALEVKVSRLDLARFVLTNHLETAVLEGTGRWAGGAAPVAFSGTLAILKFKQNFAGFGALPQALKDQVINMMTFRQVPVAVEVAGGRLALVRDLRLSGQGAAVTLAGVLDLKGSMPNWEAKVRLEMHPLAANLVTRGLFRCQTSPRSPQIFSLRGPADGPDCI